MDERAATLWSHLTDAEAYVRYFATKAQSTSRLHRVLGFVVALLSSGTLGAVMAKHDNWAIAVALLVTAVSLYQSLFASRRTAEEFSAAQGQWGEMSAHLARVWADICDGSYPSKKTYEGVLNRFQSVHQTTNMLGISPKGFHRALRAVYESRDLPVEPWLENETA